ncbi:hypothetical protein EPR50_G00188610 [Perca flavescens]|uniref:Uncharacterized protein n=1 Tax=Perca flavescens TaxID=8167 RepID=A0A484C950_PERFV|nr:uncharacterized protein LOC114573727 [Perca flavescens]TDH00451.1 hypothetical protein EPR50_G00188610 [Perca flavescens]
MRLQDMQQNGNQQATYMRKHSGSQTVQKQAPMTTEYQEMFLSPLCYKAIVSAPSQKGPYHALKGTSADVRSYYLVQKRIPKAPQPSLPPVGHRSSNPLHSPTHFVANQMASQLEDSTSVHQSKQFEEDFQAWKANKCSSQKTSVQVAAISKQVAKVQEPQPFEKVTSYTTDYVTHQLPPRRRREKPVYQTKGLPLESAVSLKPKMAWNPNQEAFDEASEFFQQFKTWSLENQFHSQGKMSEIK